MSTSKRTSRTIDRQVPGVGRLTIRTGRMITDARNELDRAITRAIQAGHLEQLRLLKGRQVTPMEFLEAVRKNALPALRPSPRLVPLINQWLAVTGLRESSRKRYEQSLRFVFASLPPDPALADLDGRWWAGFAAGRKVSTATLNRDRAAVLAFLNWARTHGYETANFAPKRMKEEPKRSGILTPEQFSEIKAACRLDRWPYFWTLAETGARQGEILNLTAPDIPPDEDAVLIRSAPGAKGRGRERSVPVSGELAQCLRTLAVVSGTGRIFQYSRTTVQAWWRDVCRECRIHGVTLHGLRATFITRALDAGIPAVEVQKLVGHSDISMTMRYYRNPKSSRTAAEQIRAALGLGQTSQEARSNPALVPASPERVRNLEVL